MSRSLGLLNPHHFLAVAISYLFTHRQGWPAHAGVGKTVVSSGIIDRVVAGLGRRLVEVPVGFKWFVNGLLDSSLAFAGEESAGATFLRRDGTVWTTDKDGIIMGLLAAEMTAVMGRDPGELYQRLTHDFGAPVYFAEVRPLSISRGGRNRPRRGSRRAYHPVRTCSAISSVNPYVMAHRAMSVVAEPWCRGLGTHPDRMGRTAVQAQQKPDIVVIWDDDIGPSQVSFWSCGCITGKTPVRRYIYRPRREKNQVNPTPRAL